MPRKTSILPHLVMHLIVVLFLAFPAWVTYMLPTTWIDLKRDGDRVDMKASICLLLVIPFERVRIEGLETVRIKAGDIRINGNEGPMTLVFEGNERTAELPALRTSASNLKKRIERFLDSPTETPAGLFTTAHIGITIFCSLWAAFFLSIYAVYLLSWIIPQKFQWWLLDQLLNRLPERNSFRSKLETQRKDYERS